MESRSADRRARRAPRPLDAARLDALALAYVARFATSTGRLKAYLTRKVRECGWDDGGTPETAAPDAAAPDIGAIVQQMVALGYVDDAAFAEARGAGLLRRGYGARRIDEALAGAGVAAPLRAQAQGTARARRAAALAFARRRRFGPFGTKSLDPVTREKQVAAFLRAGHPLASARALVDAPGIAAAEEWVDDALD